MLDHATEDCPDLIERWEAQNRKINENIVNSEPLFLPNFLEGRASCCNLWEEEKSCLTWLDMQQVASIIYVSFGSIAVKSEEQLEQLALGLEGSGQPFLWVLRVDTAELL